MPQYLITYDLKKSDPSPYVVFLEEAEGQDLLYIHRVSGGDLFRLPNSTIWGNFATRAHARAAFDRACTATEKRLGVTVVVEKRVTTKLEDWGFLSDKKKAPEAKWTKSTDFETCRAHQRNDPYF